MAFGVDVEVAKTAVVFLTLVGEKQAEADCKENQTAFFRKDFAKDVHVSLLI